MQSRRVRVWEHGPVSSCCQPAVGLGPGQKLFCTPTVLLYFSKKTKQNKTKPEE